MALLKDNLAAIRRAAEGDGTKPGRIPPEFLTIMHRVTADQRASGFRERMPQPEHLRRRHLPCRTRTERRFLPLTCGRRPVVLSFFAADGDLVLPT